MGERPPAMSRVTKRGSGRDGPRACLDEGLQEEGTCLCNVPAWQTVCGSGPVPMA